jgi:murein DD-endopeptidase MepM/ murein hydrolase activator NlpD
LASPLEELGPAGSFGSRRFFNDQPRSPHSGADYAAAEGAAVFSVAPGTVVLAADLFFSGNSVFVDHGDGLVSMYFHLRSISVVEGEALESQAVIGEVGQTGRTTGPHLHLGFRWRGARVDPDLLLGPTEAMPKL